MAKAPKVFISWQPYAPLEEAKNFIETIEHSGVQDLYLALPYNFIQAIPPSSPKHYRRGFRFQPEIQEKSFTSSISARLIKENGGEFVLLGLKFSRKYLKEDNESIRQKMQASRLEGIEPILCIGETWQEYSSELSAEVLTRQLAEALRDLNDEIPLTIVYEAPWTREAPYKIDMEELDHAYHFCRDLIYSLYGENRTTVLCPIPHDQLQPLEAMLKIQAEGYYLDNPTHYHDIKNRIQELALTGKKHGKELDALPSSSLVKKEHLNKKKNGDKKDEGAAKENKPAPAQDPAKEHNEGNSKAENLDDSTTFEEIQEIEGPDEEEEDNQI